MNSLKSLKTTHNMIVVTCFMHRNIKLLGQLHFQEKTEKNLKNPVTFLKSNFHLVPWFSIKKFLKVSKYYTTLYLETRF